MVAQASFSVSMVIFFLFFAIHLHFYHLTHILSHWMKRFPSHSHLQIGFCQFDTLLRRSKSEKPCNALYTEKMWTIFVLVSYDQIIVIAILVCCSSIVRFFLLHFSLHCLLFLFCFLFVSSILSLPTYCTFHIAIRLSRSLSPGFFIILICLLSHRLSWYKCITIVFSISLIFWSFHTCIPLRCDLQTTLILTTLLTIQYNNQIPIDYGMARKSLSDIYTCCMFPHDVTASCTYM